MHQQIVGRNQLCSTIELKPMNESATVTNEAIVHLDAQKTERWTTDLKSYRGLPHLIRNFKQLDTDVTGI